MQRILRLGLCLALGASFIAGCGSSSSSGSGSPVNTELSYFPAQTPLVLSIATDPQSSAVKGGEALLGRFPLAAFGETALIGKIQQLGLDYQSDIKPLFGNPIMIGATSPTLSSSGATSNYLIVAVAKDSGKLKALVKKIGARSVGSHAGATLYQTGGTTTLAVDGATALLGPSEQSVDAALDRHQNGGGVTAADYNRAFTGIPQGSLVQIFGNVRGLLAQPSAASAMRVPWVAALRSYAVSVLASSAGLTFKYRLDTTGRSLSNAQLPFSPGSSPSLAGTMPIGVGIQDPTHILQFAEQVEQAVSPASYAKFLARQAASRRKTGVDLNTFANLLTGNLIIASDTHTTLGRVQVTNPSQASADLAKLARNPRAVFKKAVSSTPLPGGFYAIHEPGTTLTAGVVGNQLVVGKASVAQLRGFAAAPTTPAPGAQGSVAFRVALVELLRLALKNSTPQAVQSILNSLGDITGWLSSNPSGVTGSATLAVQ
jgi:hypothetical protein